MNMDEARKKGGGKLSRSETVTVRLDPKLRYMAELAARKQRRTLSSFIEWSIEQCLKDVPVPDRNKGENSSLAQMSESLWDVSAPKRLVKLAHKCPELLNYKEQRVWELLDVWRACWDIDENDNRYFRWDLLNVMWKEFEQYGNEEISEEDLGPKVQMYLQKSARPSTSEVIRPQPRYIDQEV